MRQNRLKLIAFIISVSILLVSCNAKKADISPTPIPTNTPVETPKVQLLKAAFLYWDDESDNTAISMHKDAAAYLRTLGYECLEITIPHDKSAGDIFKDIDVDITFLTSYSMQSIADEYNILSMGNMKFSLYNMYWPLENVRCYNINSYEAYYLCAMALASVSKTSKAGFIASYSDTSTIQCINAFALGMKAFDPDSVVVIRWRNAENSDNFAGDIQALKEMGCDVIAHKQLSNSVNAAADKAGLYFMSDLLNDSLTDYDSYTASQKINLGIYFDTVLRDVLNDSFKENDVDYLGIENGVISIDINNSILDDEAKRSIDDRMKSIKDNSFKVFSGPIYDAYEQLIVPEGMQMDIDDLAGMMWFVDNVVGDIPAG